MCAAKIETYPFNAGAKPTIIDIRDEEGEFVEKLPTGIKEIKTDPNTTEVVLDTENIAVNPDKRTPQIWVYGNTSLCLGPRGELTIITEEPGDTRIAYQLKPPRERETESQGVFVLITHRGNSE